MPRDRDNAPPRDRTSVGYGCPPVANQFRPGVSGNPSGRPKGSPTLQDLIARESRRCVKIKTAGGINEIRKSEALIRKIYNMALDGDLAAARLLLQHGTPAADVADNTPPEQVIDPAAIDDESIKRMLSRLEGHLPKDTPK
jgi:Family of unknown function (DUF5681)